MSIPKSLTGKEISTALKGHGAFRCLTSMRRTFSDRRLCNQLWSTSVVRRRNTRLARSQQKSEESGESPLHLPWVLAYRRGDVLHAALQPFGLRSMPAHVIPNIKNFPIFLIFKTQCEHYAPVQPFIFRQPNTKIYRRLELSIQMCTVQQF